MKRAIRIEGDVAYVPLTKGYEAVIDAADVPLVDGFNWCAQVQSHTVYAIRRDCSGPTPSTVRMHRAIISEIDGLEVDHRDGNGLNNRRNNLRESTKAQNQQNSRIRRNNTSGFKGVCWDKASGKWMASIKANGKRRTLGRFTTPDVAHAAYVMASRALHGEFGRIA